MHRFFAKLLLASMLAGCAATPYPLPIDTTHRLQVHRAYGPLSNFSQVYFQNGARIDEDDVDKWTTYCALRVFDSTRGADYQSRVEPGEFSISRVQIRYHSSEGPLYFPTLGLSFGLGRDPDDIGPPDYYLYAVIMRLASPDQPDVKSLVCQRKWAVRGNFFPTLADMRAALGDAMTLEGPAG